MKRRGRVVIAVAATLAAATVARGGHELSVYPSYYPHEITISTVAPDRAAELLRDGKIQAYVGRAPIFVGAVPGSIGAAELLGSLVIVRVNPLSLHAKDDASACAAVRAAARAIAVNGDVALHPYPVTPFHGDYLYHADRVEQLTASLLGNQHAAPAIKDLKVRATGAAARRIPHNDAAPGAPWDIEIEEVAASELVSSTMTMLNGWLGPSALKAGWYQAWLLLGDATDGEVRERVEGNLRRLQDGGSADAVEHINLERDLVGELIASCRKVIIGYTVKREYYNADFSAGIENIAYDAQLGLNSPMFIRTVKLKDFPWNGWLALGVDARGEAAWNPIAGFGDAFGRLMWAALGDPAAMPAPYDASWLLNRISDVQSTPRR
jgi:hypothetical protein